MVMLPKGKRNPNYPPPREQALIDLALTIRRLAARLSLRSKSISDKELATSALKLLKRKGLEGSPLRDVRATALEEAARVCEAGMNGTSKSYAGACFQCAGLIRQLKNK